MGDGNSKTKEETGGDEHLEVGGSALKNNGQDHDGGTNEDTPATTEAIGDVRNDGQSNE